jgi:ABC-type polysaccharide/polyol phosphate export permease
MNDVQVAFWLTLALAFQVIAIVVAFIFVFAKPEGLHILLKIGIASMVFGLVVQIVRSIHYLDNGFYPIDRYFPLWLTKDIGSMVLVYYFAFVHKRTA